MTQARRACERRYFNTISVTVLLQYYFTACLATKHSHPLPSKA